MGRAVNHQKNRPQIKNFEQFDSFLNMYNSEVDPRMTVTSFYSKKQFNFTTHFARNPVKPNQKFSLNAYKTTNPRSLKPKRKKRWSRLMTAKFKMPKVKNFIKTAETLREIKKEIMDDNNYVIE
jgi:hypothetical protein